MSDAKQKVINLPNLISIIRILMAPVLIYLALTQQPHWYIAMLIFTVFTDLLDGFLARILRQITEMGSHLDSWGDFVIYNTMALCAWLLWPDIVEREKTYFIIIVLSFILPAIIGYIKFHRFTSYHTWAVKLAVAVTIISYLLLFTGMMDWPFRVAAVLCLYAGVEEIVITMLIHHEHVDVRSFRQALRYHRENR